MLPKKKDLPLKIPRTHIIIDTNFIITQKIRIVSPKNNPNYIRNVSILTQKDQFLLFNP